MIFANFENLPLWGEGCISPELIIESKHSSEKPTRTYVEINLNPWERRAVIFSQISRLSPYDQRIVFFFLFLFLPCESRLNRITNLLRVQLMQRECAIEKNRHSGSLFHSRLPLREVARRYKITLNRYFHLRSRVQYNDDKIFAYSTNDIRHFELMGTIIFLLRTGVN